MIKLTVDKLKFHDICMKLRGCICMCAFSCKKVYKVLKLIFFCFSSYFLTPLITILDINWQISPKCMIYASNSMIACACMHISVKKF